jgi:hypothetical protein
VDLEPLWRIDLYVFLQDFTALQPRAPRSTTGKEADTAGSVCENAHNFMLKQAYVFQASVAMMKKEPENFPASGSYFIRFKFR